MYAHAPRGGVLRSLEEKGPFVANLANLHYRIMEDRLLDLSTASQGLDSRQKQYWCSYDINGLSHLRMRVRVLVLELITIVSVRRNTVTLFVPRKGGVTSRPRSSHLGVVALFTLQINIQK